MEIKRVAVIGAGAMGTGIAYVCATKGYEVSIRDINEDLIKRGTGKIREMIATGVNRGKLTPKEAQETMKRIKGTTDIEALKDADLVIEAVFEDMDLKKRIFKELDETCPPHTILASNTSTLSITEMASATKRADKVIGLHFFNPAYTMKLIEIISGKQTSEETRRIATNFSISLEKEPVQVKKDVRGFIVNRILGAAMGEAIYLFEKGIASADDIDKAVVLGLNWPMGPLKLADFVGLDVVYHSSKSTAAEMDEEYIRKRFRPSELLEKMVKEGRLGMKTRKGFYEY